MTAIFNGTNQTIRFDLSPFRTANSPLDTNGIWMSCLVYVPSTPSGYQFIMTMTDNASEIGNTISIGINASQQFVARWRNNGGVFPEATGASATAGWHLVTARWRQDSGTNGIIDLWVDGNAVVSSSSTAFGSLDFSDFDDLLIGGLTSSNNFNGEVAGAGGGIGAADAAHAYAWNSGTAREITGYTFAGDATENISFYFPLDREDTVAITALQTEAIDTQTFLSGFANRNTTLWSTRVAVFNSGVTPEVATVGPFTTGLSGTRLYADLELATNDWDTPTADHTAFSLFSTLGYGEVTITAATIDSISGTSARLVLTTSRAVSTDERLELDADADAVTDADSNATPALSAESVSAAGGAAPPATATGFSRGRCWIKFNSAAPVSWFADEVGVVDDPGSLTITETFPAQTTEGGDIIHGMMKNMQRGASGKANKQGWDERLGTSGSQGTWDATLNETLPLSASANDCIVKCSSQPGPLGTAPRQLSTVEYLICHFVSEIPANPGNTISPPHDGYAGTSARPQPIVDLAAFVSDQPSRNSATAPASEDVATTIERFCQPCPAVAFTDAAARDHYPRNFTNAGGGYGGERVRTIEDAVMHLHGNVATTAQKKQIAAFLLSAGCSIYYCFTQSGVSAVTTPGAQDLGWIGAVAVFLNRNGNSAALATLEDDVGMNELTHLVRLTASNEAGKAPHDTSISSSYTGDNWWMCRRRNVSAVNGNVITTDETGSVILWTDYDDCVMINETQGDLEVEVTANSRGNPDFTLASGHGTQVNDVVYFLPAPSAALVAGVVWWSEFAGTRGGSSFGSNNQTYIDLDRFYCSLMLIEQEGLVNRVQGGVKLQEFVRNRATGTWPTADHPVSRGFATTESLAWFNSFGGQYLALASGSVDPRLPGSFRQLRMSRSRTNTRLRA